MRNNQSLSTNQLPPASTISTAGNLIVSQSNSNLKKPVEDTLLEKARRNMEKATALQFRQNTGNGGYGFDHILKRMP